MSVPQLEKVLESAKDESGAVAEADASEHEDSQNRVRFPPSEAYIIGFSEPAMNMRYAVSHNF